MNNYDFDRMLKALDVVVSRLTWLVLGMCLMAIAQRFTQAWDYIVMCIP